MCASKEVVSPSFCPVVLGVKQNHMLYEVNRSKFEIFTTQILNNYWVFSTMMSWFSRRSICLWYCLWIHCMPEQLLYPELYRTHWLLALYSSVVWRCLKKHGSRGCGWPVGKCWYCQKKLLNLDYSSGSMGNCHTLDGGEGRVELGGSECGDREVMAGVEWRGRLWRTWNV